MSEQLEEPKRVKLPKKAKPFKTFWEIDEKNVVTQQDYLMKRIVYEKAQEVGQQDQARAGASLEALALRSKEVVKYVNNELYWSSSDDDRLRLYQHDIDKALEKLHIDKDAFKTKIDKHGNRYVSTRCLMTEGLEALFDYVLDKKETTVWDIRHDNFNKVMKSEWRQICECVDNALDAAMCSEETRQAAKARFYDFLEKRNIPQREVGEKRRTADKEAGFPRYESKPHNRFVDVLLDEVWKAAAECGWEPPHKSISHSYFDKRWLLISEVVYERLYEAGYLQAEMSSYMHTQIGIIKEPNYPTEVKPWHFRAVKTTEGSEIKNVKSAESDPTEQEKINELFTLSNDELMP